MQGAEERAHLPKLSRSLWARVEADLIRTVYLKREKTGSFGASCSVLFGKIK